MENDFVWDLAKEALNIQKHGVNFETASEAFADSNRQLRADSKHGAEEIRYFCLGKVGERILTVRFVYRDNKIRIIGAGYWRKVTKNYEKKESLG